MDPLFQSIVGSFIRALLMVGGTFLVQHGIWKQGDLEGFISGLTLAIVGLAWSAWEKWIANKLVIAAIAAPSTSSVADVKASLKG